MDRTQSKETAPESDGDSEIPEPYAAALRARGFELREQIGNGLFGVVYRASQTMLGGRDVAVKFYEATRTADGGKRQRFEREAQLLARLEHPGIPYVLTRGEVQTSTGPVPYHVLQLVRGKRLDALMKHRARLAVKDVVRIARDILSALRHAHSREIIHRDIAPANVIVHGAITYLLDFSLGFSLHYEPGLTRATESGDRFGRPEYASPEQRRGSLDTDHRTDIHAVGVLLHEMLTGETSLQNVLNDQRIGSLVLRRAILKACAANPNDRYQSAQEFIEALDAVIGSPAERETVANAICPSTTCPDAVWSNRGFFKGPHIAGPTNADYCGSCRSAFIKRCRVCSEPLPENVREKLITTKAGPDRLELGCGGCSARPLSDSRMWTVRLVTSSRGYERTRRVEGCSKCATTSESNEPAGDDDLPF